MHLASIIFNHEKAVKYNNKALAGLNHGDYYNRETLYFLTNVNKGEDYRGYNNGRSDN